ncbi:GntR family transcriptional regulator [Dactylosporangium sp. AC04546]|uniref:FadR/GntR family transcriptional regulator n=1 Tax=Dactylosporangium sp. AC04546 TaxID=2862460 RepID=UPI001EDF0468|nr:FCD domain-containing protein [Dactylosporangium sp. AC04546]WVK88082.1 GntR family transcriptional regulator [Dactylosporangium sp. AC04546]
MTTARSFTGRRRRSRALEVQDEVKELIVRRRLTAGDPLPTESELVEELGVGRNAVREALKALQAVGIVDIRHGFGMFVGRMSLNGLVDELTFHGRISSHLGHLIELREALETGLVQLLIDGYPAASSATVDEVLARMDAESQVGLVTPETDKLFHDVLYRPLGNPLVGQLLSAFWDVYHQLHDELGDPDEAPLEVARKHRDIRDAVVAGDKEAAAAAMRAHFAGVRSRLARLASRDADSAEPGA